MGRRCGSGGGICVCVCVCVCETEEGVVRGRAGDISRKQSGQALCGAALGDCGGVYIYCRVCVCVCVC